MVADVKGKGRASSASLSSPMGTQAVEVEEDEEVMQEMNLGDRDQGGERELPKKNVITLSGSDETEGDGGAGAGTGIAIQRSSGTRQVSFIYQGLSSLR